MRRLNGNAGDHAPSGINGSPGALDVDRAVGELRRGRCVEIREGQRCFLAAALETVQPAVLSRLLAASDRVALILTPERVAAATAGATPAGPVSIPLDGRRARDALEAYAGIRRGRTPGEVGLESVAWTGSATLLAAAFRLAKAGRLVPALVGFESEGPADRSIARVAVEDVEQYAGYISRSLTRTAESRVPLADAERTSVALFRDEYGGGEHVAVIIGEPDPRTAVPVRLHSACLTGDVLGSLRCDCGEQLKAAVRRIAELGGGVLLYLDQEGRGIGLANKLRAYSIQDTGLDTLDADRHLGFTADERNYDIAAALLRELGFSRVRLLTNNPQKIDQLREHGIDVVGRVPLVTLANSHNEGYLRAKRERAGHLAEDIDSPRAAADHLSRQ